MSESDTALQLQQLRLQLDRLELDQVHPFLNGLLDFIADKDAGLFDEIRDAKKWKDVVEPSKFHLMETLPTSDTYGIRATCYYR